MKIFIYTIVFLIANLVVYFGIMKPWKEDLEYQESIPVVDLTIDSLCNTDYFSLPIYFRLKDVDIKDEMTEVATEIMQPSVSRYITNCIGLIPVVEKGATIKGNPVLVWMYFFKVRKNKIYDWHIPFDLKKWKGGSAIFKVLRYDSLHEKMLSNLLEKIYKKYGIIPVNPEKMCFVSPIMQKVDWSAYNKVSKYLFILDILGFLPIFFALLIKFFNKA